MKKEDYFEKLRDPRWQKRRLEILERDEWCCMKCYSETKELHVHHLSYEWNQNPWDYDSEQLITLCNECHEYEKVHLKDAKKQLINSIVAKFHFSETLRTLASGFDNMELGYSEDVVCEALCGLISDQDNLCHFTEGYHGIMTNFEMIMHDGNMEERRKSGIKSESQPTLLDVRKPL